MPHAERVGLVYNPAAGSTARIRPRRTVDQVIAALREQGAEPQPLPTRGPGDGIVRALEAAREFSTVAVMGGDGTVNEAINGVVAAGTGARLLLLPSGTVNVLARDLRIPLDACRAAALLRSGKPRRIYLGRANGRYFGMMVSAGVDASIVRRLSTSRLKRPLGVFAYILEGLRHTISYRFPRITVRADGKEIEGYLAVAANSPGYGGWFSICAGADPCQPGFQVGVCVSANALKYYGYLGLALGGSLHRTRDFVFFPATRVELVSASEVPAQIDGEPFGALPVEVVSEGTTVQVIVKTSEE